MKYISEYRNSQKIAEYARHISESTNKSWTIMEICGGQTHAILRFGIDQLLPDTIDLVHGPGCPVCVTDIEIIDRAQEIASRPGVILCSFGDMLRVPGSETDLLSIRAGGGDVRTVYSPLDAIGLALENPDKEVVFFAVGFETTVPATATAILAAKQKKLANFSILCSHVLVTPAMETILSSPDNRVQGFLAAGHVSTVIGYEVYRKLADRYKIPIVVTGFEPIDLLQGIYLCIKQLEEGRACLENQYSRAVRKEGNPKARELMETFFEITDRRWRGLGVLPAGGLKLRQEFSVFDAEIRFPGESATKVRETECISGQILQGAKKPSACPMFGTDCTPERPLGATMVSSEGACAAYYRYRR